MRVHPIQRSTFDETLPLFPELTTRRRYDKREAAQIAKCDRILAAQQKAETPRWRRCDVCDGLEDTTHPHAHPEAA